MSSSHHVFFMFSAGLAKAIRAPRGTLAGIIAQVQETEANLGLKTTQYLENPPHWVSTSPGIEVTDDVLCEAAEKHNKFVRWLYGELAKWSSDPVVDGEDITPEDAAKFWHGLQVIPVPVERWTADYYRERMEHLYEVLRGREGEGSYLNTKALTIKQADAVINLLSEWLDHDDIRLAVPNGRDCLKSSYDGGYMWCEKCGAVDEDELDQKIRCCRKRGGCPLRQEYGDE